MIRHLPILAALTLAALATPIQAQPMPGGFPGGGAGGPVAVGTLEMQPTSVPMTTRLPGRVSASSTAEVRPQVGGIITNVTFTEGHRVTAGDLLYEIDAATYKAERAAAQAALDKAQAMVPSAQATLDRYQSLANNGGVSQADIDTATASLMQAKADVASAEASLAIAQISLDHTRIVAPISGVIGLSNVKQGSLVTANQTDALATIRQIDPIDVQIVESSTNLLALRKTMASAPERQPVAQIVLEDGSTYDEIGTVSVTDMAVSETTGSVTLRASFANPDAVLLPGMFVRATVTMGSEDDVYLVPQRAVSFNDDGNPTAYFAGTDGKAELKVLSANRVVDNAWVVTAGIEPGDLLIVDGLQKLSDGADIAPVPVTIEDDGVVRQVLVGAADLEAGQ